MPNKVQNPNAKVYDLEERTAKFGEAVIDFVKTLSRNAINNPLISQGFFPQLYVQTGVANDLDFRF